MDYTKVPRALIYKERTDLNEFGVKVHGTMNHLLFSNLKELFKATDRLKELILRCFNNAYYICTIIPFEDFPDTQVAEYEKLLLKDDPYDLEEVCAVSMAMVCKLLPASDIRWMPENSDLIEQIRYRFTHYQWIHRGASNSFEFMEGKHNTDELIISSNEFVPCEIIEVIENCSIRDLQVYAEYICERLAHLEDPRQRMYGADMAIARIKDYQREVCEDSEYNPKKDCFHYADNDSFVRDLTWEESVRRNYRQSNEAIDYYTEHYPKKENNDSKEKDAVFPQASETEATQTKIREQDLSQSELSNSEIAQLQSRIKELQEALDKEKAKNVKLEKEIADYVEPVENLTASQNVRMELAVELLRAAGMSDNMLERAYRKKATVARLIMLLTDIRSDNARNHPEHSCAKYLSERKYLTKDNKELIIEINKICVELGLNVTLSLGL